MARAPTRWSGRLFAPFAFYPIYSYQLASDIRGQVADFVAQVLFGDALPPRALDEASNKLAYVLRSAGSAVLLSGVNAVLDPKINVLPLQ